MSQRAEKEETEFKVPEPLTLCVNNCGVSANPATNNMCQNCFNATAATSTSAVTVSTASALTFTAERSPRSRSSRPVLKISQSPTIRKPIQSPQDESAEKTGVNRCCGCRKKVGLTGFRCRCGELFCAKHRYSDRHDCSYDYKTAGRDAIARENPVVKAAKIVKI